MEHVYLYIQWRLSPEIFHFHGFALRYYSVLFALGFACGIWILQGMYAREGVGKDKINKLLIYVATGTLAGARLGHCLFYDWPYFQHHIAEIFLPLQIGPGGHIAFTGYQGLASHGGALGILLATLLYCRKYKVPVLWLLDRLVIVVALAGFFIRIGNLFNSEIIGRPTMVPWAFIFERVDDVPRHPAQLYEALGYLIIFLFLNRLYRKNVRKHQGNQKCLDYQCNHNDQDYQRNQGNLFSLFLISVFGFRFLIELYKQNQAAFENAMLLDMGQWLSIPFILLGVYMQLKIRKKGRLRSV